MKKAKRFPTLLPVLCLTLGLLPGKALAATDIPESAWYSGAVQYVYEQGLMCGTGSGAAFEPDSFARKVFVIPPGIVRWNDEK